MKFLRNLLNNLLNKFKIFNTILNLCLERIFTEELIHFIFLLTEFIYLNVLLLLKTIKLKFYEFLLFNRIYNIILFIFDYFTSKYKIYLVNLITLFALIIVSYCFKYYYELFNVIEFNIFIITICVFILLFSKFFLIILVYDFTLTIKFLYKNENDKNNIFFSYTLNSFVGCIFLALSYFTVETLLRIQDLELLEAVKYYTLIYSIFISILYSRLTNNSDLDLDKLEKETTTRNIKTFILIIFIFVLFYIVLQIYFAILN